MVPSVASEKIPSDTTGDRSRDSTFIGKVENNSEASLRLVVEETCFCGWPGNRAFRSRTARHLTQQPRISEVKYFFPCLTPVHTPTLDQFQL
jgi:hypothetical protein